MPADRRRPAVLRPALPALALTLALTLALLGLAALASPSPADAAAKRVVALEWDLAEDLSALGVAPVGVADVRGYKTWVGTDLRGTPVDVGLRQAPSLDRIRSLRPDLILVPDYRSTRNLSQLRRIARVIVTKPYGRNGAGAHYDAMVSTFRTVARAVGRTARSRAVLREVDATYADVRRSLRARGRSGASVVVASPSGTASNPQLRLASSNSLVAGVLRRIGLRNGWGGATQFGFTTAGLGALNQIRGATWLTFVYPERYRAEISRLTNLSAFKKLPVVRARRYRAVRGDTWLYGGPRSARLAALQIGAALQRG